ncbi:chemotaxis protein CheW [Bacillus tianshenii]|nr:chemotaxis protein CheW [Bacillus tianshenii]
MASYDVSAFLGVFLDEATEQLQILDEKILELEQDSSNPETIEVIFRAAHTLKGSSGAMEFRKMNRLTHVVENVFDLIRSNHMTVDTNVINLIFEAIDQLKIIVNVITESHHDDVDCEEIIQKLDSLVASYSGGDRGNSSQPVHKHNADEFVLVYEEYQKNVILQSLHGDTKVFAVFVELVDDSQMKSIRALLIYNNLEEVGDVIASTPSTEQLENDDKLASRFVYTVATSYSEQDIFQVINSLAEIKTISITEITTDNLPHYTNGEGVQTAKAPRKAVDVVKNTSIPRVNSQTIRVDVGKLEQLMNLVGELIIDRSRLNEAHLHLANQFKSNHYVEMLGSVNDHLHRVVSELQDGMMKVRMLPIEQLFSRFPRMVRDLSQKAGKEINLVMEGKETELDRTVIEEIGDPIIHLLRNALDHGIESAEDRKSANKPETGTITLRASQKDGHIQIELIDDGAGINAEKLALKAIEKGILTKEEADSLSEKEKCQLIFHSGFSTAKAVTDISGRGVGMDIVRNSVEKLNGVIDLQTRLGEGTVFTIKLPLTLAILPALLVQIGAKPFALPLVNVVEIIRMESDTVRTINGQMIGLIRGEMIPLLKLHAKLNVKEDVSKKKVQVVVVGLAEKRVGIMIDQVIGNQEIVMKSLGGYLGKPEYITGATILGNGRVAMILDIATIVQEEGTDIAQLDAHAAQFEKQKAEAKKWLTFQVGNETFGLEAQEIHEVLNITTISPVLNAPDTVEGLIHLRDRMLPVINLQKRLNMSVENNKQKRSKVIIFETGETLFGMLVGQIKSVLAINEEEMEEVPKNINPSYKRFMKGIYRDGTSFITLLDAQSILKEEEAPLLDNLVDV